MLQRWLRGVWVTVLNLVQGDGLLQRDGVLAGVGMRGLQAHQIAMQCIERRAGKAQLRDRAINLLQGGHQAIAGEGIERDDGQGAGEAAALRHQIQHHQQHPTKGDGF